MTETRVALVSGRTAKVAIVVAATGTIAGLGVFVKLAGLDGADQLASVIGGASAVLALAITLASMAGGRAVQVHAEIVRELPAVTLYFHDREEPLRQLTAAWRRAKKAGTVLVVVCTGEGGIGKTQLAVKWLREIGARVPGPHLYVDMNEDGPRSLEDAVGKMLRNLGVAPGDLPRSAGEMLELFRRRTSEQPVLVCLDGVTRAAQVRSLVPGAAGSVVVMTARSVPDNLFDVVEVAVPPMADDDMRRLVLDVAGEGLRRASRDEIDALVSVCGGLPVEVQPAVRQLRHSSPLALAERVRRDRELAPEQEPPVNAIYDIGYGELSSAAAGVYRGLGVLFGKTFSDDMAAAVAGVSDAATQMAEIVQAGLIEDLGGGRYRFHDLGLEHARGKGEPAEREAALQRLVRWYLRKAVQADHALMPGRWRLGPEYEPYRGREGTLPKGDARQWLEGSRTGLRAAVEAADDHGWFDLVVQLVEAQWALCLQLKYHEHWIAIHLRGVSAAAELGDLRFLARMHVQLGFAYLELGRFTEAATAFTEARTADRSAGHARGEATALESLALLKLRLSGAENLPALTVESAADAEDALALLIENLRLNLSMPEAEDDPRAVALAWRHLGRAFSATGDHEQAVTHLERARALLTGLDPYNLAKTLTDLGCAHLRKGDPAAARTVLLEALGMLPEQAHPIERATVLEALSVQADREGNRDEAVEHLAAARSVLEARGHPRAPELAARLRGRA